MQATVSLTIILFLATSADVFARHIVTSSDETEPSRPLILIINSNALKNNAIKSNALTSDALRDGSAQINDTLMDYYIKKQQQRDKELLLKQQARKRAELNEFLQSRFLSTNYFYDEMKRIKRQRRVKDGLRKMIEYLEKPENSLVKKKVIQCFYNYQKQQTMKPPFNYKNNNLVINLLKDPFNDGLN